MTTKKRIFKILIISFIAVIVLLTSAWYFATYQLYRLENYKESITQALGKGLDRDVTYETGKAILTLRTGLAIRFTNVVIRDKDKTSNFLVIKTAFFRVNLLPLLRHHLVLREIIFDQPQLLLKRDANGVLNIADLLAGVKKETAIEFRRLTIRNGLVVFADQSASPDKAGGPLMTALGNLYCRVDQPIWRDTSRFHITTDVLEDKSKSALMIEGSFLPAHTGRPVSESIVDADIHLEEVNLHHYRPYFIKYLPFERLDGRLKVEAKFSGTFANFISKGNVTFNDAVLNYPQVFHGPVRSTAASADYTLKRDNGNIRIDVARLALDHIAVAGNFSLRDMDKDDPLLEANAVTSVFNFKEVRSYVPWRIIPGGVGEFIEEHIKDGNFRLTEGRLIGRISQIKDFLKPENAGLLTIRALADNAVFTPGGTSPVFHDIHGNLELIKREFMIKNIKARFGASPCTVEGGISDFGVPGPSVYVVNMNLIPTRDELLWLFGKKALSDLKYNPSSVLYLSAQGPDDHFDIKAKWDLANNDYSFGDLLEKPQGRANKIDAEIIINKAGFLIPSFKYDLPPFEISGKVMIPFKGKSPVTVNVGSKAFNIHEAAGVLPLLQKVDPAGNALLGLTGRGYLEDIGSLSWKGNLSLTNVSLKPSGGVRPVKGLTGGAVFQGSKMSTSLFKATIGESPFQAKCRMDDFHQLKTACGFDALSLKPADIGLQGREPIRDIKGQVYIEDKHLRVDRLAFRSRKSVYNLAGDIRDFDNPKINMTLISPYIRWDDLAYLLAMKPYPKLKQGEKNKSKSNMELGAVLRVDAGVFNDIDFRKLSAALKYNKGILNIETLEAGIFDGNLKTKGRVDIRPDAPNRYAFNFSADRLSLDKLQNFIKYEDHFFSGNLSVAGDVTAVGSNADDFKKTADGTLKIRAEKGVLKRFSVLSKIFSILNVYQLFKFQLPDMASNGMPYNAITADISFKDGILSSDNFFIDSDAMQISGIGKIDLVKKEIDNTVAIHPLHTIDKIVSKIPIAGWLVTDEKGNLITVHFKVEGKLDDPKVSLIPAKSIAKGTLDIFRRIFQLPGQLVTNTEDVLLGH
ncbi:MAG TPA: AsmA-like C-terminal domain-containing protein [Smithella sp.]|nr:AsmA-like C-terminal domain-containing protein [Smithella sp.]